MTAPLVVSDPIGVADELSRIGDLTVEILQNAVRGGLMWRATATANDPRSLAGTTFWGKTIGAFREQTLPAGWTKSEDSNYSLTLSPDRSVAIVVATGDQWTGSSNHTPSTSYPKGPKTAEVVELNNQYALPGILDIAPAQSTDTPIITWMLLIYYDGKGGARSELSIPSEIDADGWVCGWAKRIILPPIEGDEPDSAARLRGPESGPEFDVEVTRRAG